MVATRSVDPKSQGNLGQDPSQLAGNFFGYRRPDPDDLQWLDAGQARPGRRDDESKGWRFDESNEVSLSCKRRCRG